MAYNTTHTRFKSQGLAGLDCGSYLKVPRRDKDVSIIEIYTGDLEVGQCVAMIRIPAGARITGADLSWSGTSVAILGVGDPYACARLLGPISTARPRGALSRAFANITAECTAYQPYGTCGTLTKVGREGDGCGFFYQYTCETDVLVTNLYSENNANQGGWQGGAVVANAGTVGAKWTGGALVLSLTYKVAS